MKRTFLALICMAVISFASTAQASSLYAMEIANTPPFTLVDTTKWLAVYAPEILEDMEAIHEMSPGLYEEILLMATEEVAMIEQIRELDPDSFKEHLKTAYMEVRTELLALQYARAKSSKEKAELKEEIRTLTEKTFDAHMAEHNSMVDEIETELNDLKRQGEIRAKNRDKIIERRMNDLTTPNSQALEWW